MYVWHSRRYAVVWLAKLSPECDRGVISTYGTSMTKWNANVLGVCIRNPNIILYPFVCTSLVCASKQLFKCCVCLIWRAHYECVDYIWLFCEVRAYSQLIPSWFDHIRSVQWKLNGSRRMTINHSYSSLAVLLFWHWRACNFELNSLQICFIHSSAIINLAAADPC